MPFTNTHSIDLESGSSQYLSRTNGGAFDNTTLSVECWFRLESIGASEHIISTQTNAGNGGFYIFYNSGTGKIDCGLGNGTKQISTTTSPSAGTWYHISFAFNTTNAEIILNGASEVTNGSWGSMTAGNDLKVGVVAFGALGGYFDGLIDDIRIWTTKRSVANVLADYRTVLNGNESNLIAYWKLDNDYTDSTSNARTLTANGAPSFSTVTNFTGFTDTEIIGTSVETILVTPDKGIGISEVSGTPVDNFIKFSDKWVNQTKSDTSGWVNQIKS